VIEVEACFKAAQVAIQQGCPLQAASFLKNVTLINLTLSESEKVSLSTAAHPKQLQAMR